MPNDRRRGRFPRSPAHAPCPDARLGTRRRLGLRRVAAPGDPRLVRIPLEIDADAVGQRVHGVGGLVQGILGTGPTDRRLDGVAEDLLIRGIGAHFAGYPYGESTLRYKYATVLECNWKVAMYAFSEGYHVPTIHRVNAPGLMRFEHKDFKLFGPHGTSAFHVLPVDGLTEPPATALFREVLHDRPRHALRLDELPASMNTDRRDDFLFEFASFFPNTVLHLSAGNGYPGMTYFTHQFWPIDVGRTYWEGTNYFRPPERPSERIAIAHTTAWHRNGWLEDTSTMEDTYAALSSGVLNEIVLMDEELLIRNTQKHWYDFIEAD